jgi:hypothetical protein
VPPAAGHVTAGDPTASYPAGHRSVQLLPSVSPAHDVAFTLGPTDTMHLSVRGSDAMIAASDGADWIRLRRGQRHGAVDILGTYVHVKDATSTAPPSFGHTAVDEPAGWYRAGHDRVHDDPASSDVQPLVMTLLRTLVSVHVPVGSKHLVSLDQGEMSRPARLFVPVTYGADRQC